MTEAVTEVTVEAKRNQVWYFVGCKYGHKLRSEVLECESQCWGTESKKKELKKQSASFVLIFFKLTNEVPPAPPPVP